jgi:hypothetical protein
LAIAGGSVSGSGSLAHARRADDRLDHRLEGAMALHHGRQHHVLGQFLGLGLDHQHAFGGAGDDEVERALLGLLERRVDDELAVEIADAAPRRSGP